MIKADFKEKLHDYCCTIVEEQVSEITASINNQNEGAQGTSSAGDKHNTEGAMQHLELQKKHVVLATAMQNQEVLEKINTKRPFQKVNTGALVQFNKGLFYFSVALGKVQFKGKEVMVLSIGSPIGQLLRGAKKGDSKTFNDTTWDVEEIY